MPKQFTPAGVMSKMVTPKDRKADRQVMLEGEDEMISKIKSNKAYIYSKDEKRLFKARKKRFESMLKKKKELGINAKCDIFDRLFIPHMVDLNDPNMPAMSGSAADIGGDASALEQPRKSTPLAFEKITTAIAVMIKENPKIKLRAFREKFKRLNLFIENVYYENFKQQRKIRILKRYTYHLAKYGIAYWREYIKRTYRKEHVEKIDPETGEPVKDKSGNVVYETKLVFDVNDQVAEVIHPRNVVLDDNCLGPSDPQRPARDLFLLYYYTQSEFEAMYPSEIYPNAKFIKEGQSWMFEDDEVVDPSENRKEGKIQVVIYENKFEDVREIWANGIPIESIPLPGHVLSVTGDKWIEGNDDYDGVGVGLIILLYLPLVDDINNASAERLRQIVRPVEDFYNGAKISDESEDVEYQAGNQRHIDGKPGDVIYSKPPAMTAGEREEIERILEELDRTTMLPKHLTGQAESKTAFEAAQNRETALAKLNIPTDNIKWTLEEAANISLALWPIIYGDPEYTEVLKPGDDDFNEALAIWKTNPDDDRVVPEDEENPEAGIYRRHFKEMELPLDLKPEEGEDSNQGSTGMARIVTTEEAKFWELTPSHFNWKGRIEVISGSFLPYSQALEDEKKKETVDFLINVPTTDEFGRPTLTDANGKPYTIDKVRAVKDRIAIVRDFDPEKYVIPMDQENAKQGDLSGSGQGNPLEDSGKIMDAVEKATSGSMERPETRGTKALK